MSADDDALARKLSGVPRLISPVEPGEVVYPSAGVRTCPALTGMTVKVAAADVLAGPDVAIWGGGSSQDSELRLVTTGDFDPQSTPSGVIKRAAWVVTIHDPTPNRRGPRGRPPPDMTVPVTCISTVIVDAETGALLLNLQECRPGPLRTAGSTAARHAADDEGAPSKR